MKRTPLKRRKPLNKVSKKRAVQNREYAKLRRDFLIAYPYCQVCHELGAPFVPANQIHHRRHRNGERLNDIQYWMAVSDRGHKIIHGRPALAYERGWLLRK